MLVGVRCACRVGRTSVVLLPLLASMFPFYMSDVYILQCYVENLLQLTTYLPKSHGPILRIIFVELTKIDVSYSMSLFKRLLRLTYLRA